MINARRHCWTHMKSLKTEILSVFQSVLIKLKILMIYHKNTVMYIVMIFVHNVLVSEVSYLQKCLS